MSSRSVGPDGDWGRLSAAHAATRTFHELVLGDTTGTATTGTATTGVDGTYAAAHFEGVGAEIMGAAMFGLHAFPDDPQWRGWWGDQPPSPSATSCAPGWSITCAS